MKRHWIICSLGILTTVSGVALADTPYKSSRQLDDKQPNVAQLYVPAQFNPEVAVSRELAAQPVHPWMAEVQVGPQSTYVDPLQPLDRNGTVGQLSSSHSLVRAQRLHMALNGVTNEELAELSNASLAAEPRSYGGSNTATLSGPPMMRLAPAMARAPMINVIMPAGKSAKPAAKSPSAPVPIPSVPRYDTQPKGQLASLPQ